MSIDPELVEQMDAAAADEPIGAIIRLGPTSEGDVSPSPEETDRIAHALLDRAQKLASSKTPDYNIFTNLGYFVVSATPAYLKALLTSPEVAHAFPNRRRAVRSKSALSHP